MNRQNNEPGGLPTNPAQSNIEHTDPNDYPSNAQGVDGTEANISGYVRCLFEPEDIVEIRMLPSGLSTWHKARELFTFGEKLARSNRSNNIYVSANPRTCNGDGSKAEACQGGKCGRCRHCVQLARCVFVDLDKTDIVVAKFKLSESGLPAPTLTVTSGGGIHFYWRLNNPVSDMDQWSSLQRGLATRLGGDLAVHDSPRVMRLPGFLNRKPEYDPPRLCRIIDADPNRIYSVEEFESDDAPQHLKGTTAKIVDSAEIQSGSRNSTLMSLAGSMRVRGFSQDGILAGLLAENQVRCKPPLSDAEVSAIAKSASRYQAGSVAVAREWKPFPIHLFPEPARSYVVAGAQAMGCDVAYIALPVLAVIAGATVQVEREGIRLNG